MTKFLPVQGTDGWVESGPRCWWHPPHPFLDAIAAYDLEVYRPGDPWVWSTELNGWQFWRRWSWLKPDPDQDHRAWWAGAKALRWYLDGDVVHVIAHSHGGNVWAYAAGQEGVRFGRVVLVGTPLRADLMRLYERAIARSEQVLFVTDADQDRTQAAGRFGDGHLGRTMLPAGVGRFPVIGMGHSGLLYQPQRFPAAIAHVAGFLQGAAV